MPIDISKPMELGLFPHGKESVLFYVRPGYSYRIVQYMPIVITIDAEENIKIRVEYYHKWVEL